MSRKQLANENFSIFAWFIVAFGYVICYQLLAVGGYEWVLFREAALNGGVAERVANPSYTFALLYPLFLLPLRVGIFAYSLISVCTIYATHRLIKTNKWLLLISFPVLRNLFFAQLDPLIMLGVALGWWAVEHKRPFYLGIALVLLGIKPHITGILALVYIIWGAFSHFARSNSNIPSLVGPVWLLATGLARKHSRAKQWQLCVF